MSEQGRIDDYDLEPVFYCATCLSLNIKYEEATDSDYCGKCGSTTIQVATLDNWEKMYEKKYGKKFTEKNDDIRNSPVFKMSLSKLMKKVADCPRWNDIIHEIYHHYPKGLSKADAIVLFFDKLVKDNRLNDLRSLLYQWKI